MKERPFYAEGLAFSCERCSACCRHEPGYVFLSKNDVDSLLIALAMRYTEFVETYCRWIPVDGGRARLALKEKSNFDCVFWQGGCSVYGARPLQCRTFPFWPAVIQSQETWNQAARTCPGIGKGERRGLDFIASCADQMNKARIIAKS
ncbi:MAG: YkgJ family cysteine cluster protein [Treponema sp.]|jgi:Fe-S-cluster containining protein|nr:YkgJ family cysteine cluster protein [Treponema sp.]